MLTVFHLSLGASGLPSANLPVSPGKKRKRGAGEKAIMQQNQELYLKMDFLTIKDRRVLREQLSVFRVFPQHGSRRGSRIRFNQDTVVIWKQVIYLESCSVHYIQQHSWPTLVMTTPKFYCLQKLPDVYQWQNYLQLRISSGVRMVFHLPPFPNLVAYLKSEP